MHVPHRGLRQPLQQRVHAPLPRLLAHGAEARLPREARAQGDCGSLRGRRGLDGDRPLLDPPKHRRLAIRLKLDGRLCMRHRGRASVRRVRVAVAMRRRLLAMDLRQTLEQRLEELIEVGVLPHDVPLRVGEEGIVLDLGHLLRGSVLQPERDGVQHEQLLVGQLDVPQEAEQRLEGGGVDDECEEDHRGGVNEDTALVDGSDVLIAREEDVESERQADGAAQPAPSGDERLPPRPAVRHPLEQRRAEAEDAHADADAAKVEAKRHADVTPSHVLQARDVVGDADACDDEDYGVGEVSHRLPELVHEMDHLGRDHGAA
mmetsp:Transcript_26259/g.69638  ORF Transcript_26259/g.69638 Transcript_26259/m.69638 type:complete len:318 (+) Transcript_26259:3112-4065(+)